MPGWLIAVLIGIAVPAVAIAYFIFPATNRGWAILMKASAGAIYPSVVGLALLFFGVSTICGLADFGIPNAPASVNLGFGLMQVGCGGIFLFAARKNHRAKKPPE